MLFSAFQSACLFSVGHHTMCWRFGGGLTGKFVLSVLKSMYWKRHNCIYSTSIRERFMYSQNVHRAW